MHKYVYVRIFISVLPDDHKRNFFMKLLVLINYAVIALTILIGVDILVSLRDISPVNLSPHFLFFSGVYLKFMLVSKRKDIVNLINRLQQTKMSQSFVLNIPQKRKVVWKAFASSVLIQVILFAAVIQAFAKTPLSSKNIPFFPVFEKLNVTVPDYILDIRFKVIGILPFFNHIFPFCIFLFLYSVLAWNLAKILRDFLKEIRNVDSFHQIHLTYNDIYELVQEADSALSSLALAVILHASSQLYFSVFFTMRRGMTMVYGTISNVLRVLSHMMLLYIMINIAARIPDINLEIQQAILLKPHRPSTVADKHFLMIKVQQELVLSLGGLAPIKRGLFLTLIGTILTYCLLIRSFPNEEMLKDKF